MAHIVNHDRISNQAATQHFYAPGQLVNIPDHVVPARRGRHVAFNHIMEAILPMRAVALGWPAHKLPFTTLTLCFDLSSIMCPVPTGTDRSKNSYVMQDKTRSIPASWRSRALVDRASRSWYSRSSTEKTTPRSSGSRLDDQAPSKIQCGEPFQSWHHN
jgi:hypothetical protein